MMKKYLEGIQWVLYYYYRGAQHWRWYYPFHYAPLIGDFGINLVKDFMGGHSKIANFEIDYNCPEETEPYTPFQQLLCIMPLRSFKLLPECYRKLALNDLKDFFPDDFSVDLNGKTLAWEAIVLIPFVDQTQFLDAEARMLETGAGVFTDKEIDRNRWNFCYHMYSLHPTDNASPLKSSLTSLKSLEFDFTKCTINEEYKHVGEHAFMSNILPGCLSPCVGYPSFKQLGVIDISYETVLVRKV
jgi:5'-3' exonuclease